MVATKEQELKALEEIVKIVESLGEGSYLSMTFEGCFEMAKDNIKNDFGSSYYKIAQSEGKKAFNLEQKLEDAQAAQYDLQKKAKEMEQIISKLQEEKSELQERIVERAKMSASLIEENMNLRDTVSGLQEKIIRLKARLFDLIDTENEE